MAPGHACTRALTAGLAACVLLLASLGPAEAARARRRRRAAAKPAAGPVSQTAARARRAPDEPSAPRDSLKPVVPLSGEPETTTIRTLTGRGAPDLTIRSDMPSWARGWVPPPAEEPVPGPTAEERTAAGSARARTVFVLLAVLLACLAYAWAPDLRRAAGED